MSKETHRIEVSGRVPLREGDGSAIFVGSALYSAFEGLSMIAANRNQEVLWSTLRIETKVADYCPEDPDGDEACRQDLVVEVEVMGVERG